jgi:hypothetical protein
VAAVADLAEEEADSVAVLTSEVVAVDFIALPHFTEAVLEDFATRSARGRHTDDRFPCVRRVRS